MTLRGVGITLLFRSVCRGEARHMRGTGFVWGLLAKAAPDRTDGQGPGLDRRQVLAGIAAMGLAPSLIDPAEARVGSSSRIAI
ncbi:hypothetical protein, partial [Blastomonas sp. UPD001]|uniref:hypothetical protein n=1 Tax=Blastomonas sp. UPD001 TaxID=2217673 RepID=UPI001E2D9B95